VPAAESGTRQVQDYQTEGWAFSAGVARVGGEFAPPTYIDKSGKVIGSGR